MKPAAEKVWGSIPLAALVVSLGTLVFTGLELRQKADGRHVLTVEGRVAYLEHQLEQCEAARTALERERVQLLLQIAQLAQR